MGTIKTFMKKAKFVIGLDDEYEKKYSNRDSNVTYVDRFEKKTEDETEEVDIIESKASLKVLKAPKIVIKKPLSFSDTQAIVESFRSKDRVVLDYASLNGEERKRIFDFLNGAIFALNGSIEKMSKDKYIYLPEGDYYTEDISKKFGMK